MREKGSVARSTELSGWASLLVAASLLPWLGGLAANRISGFMQATTQAMAQPSARRRGGAPGPRDSRRLRWPHCRSFWWRAAWRWSLAVGQVGLRFTPKALRFQFSRISPIAGLRRLLSGQGLWALGKTLLKMSMLGVVGYLLLHKLLHSVLGGATLPLPATLVVDVVDRRRPPALHRRPGPAGRRRRLPVSTSDL